MKTDFFYFLKTFCFSFNIKSKAMECPTFKSVDFALQIAEETIFENL